MKRKYAKLICLLSLTVVCYTLSGCGKENASGLGSLTMEDSDTDDVGVLGDPTDTEDTKDNDDSKDTDDTDTPEDTQDTDDSSTPEPKKDPTPTETDPTQPEPSDPNQPTDTQEPAPTTLTTEKYDCEYFTVTIPTGWKVDCQIIKEGGTSKNIIAIVQDPEDFHNCFFFIQALQPFFVSEEAKSAFLPYADASIKNAPVLTNPTATGTLEVWTAIYDTLHAQGFDILDDYKLTQVTESKDVSTNENGGKTSYVLGKVTIPNATQGYTMFLHNTLQHMDALQGLPKVTEYYISFSNNGIVINDGQAGSYFNTLMECIKSFNFDKYVTTQGAIKDSGSSLPDLDLSKLS